MGHIESWKNSKTIIHQSEYDGLEEHQKEGKYSSEKVESYFTLFELLQLAVEGCNAHHKSLSQLDSTSSMIFAAYNHRQNKGKSNKSK